MASNPAMQAQEADTDSGYALSGKIMLSAIIILFAVVIFMVGLHLYARWYLVRLRRRQLERRRQRRSGRTHIVLYADHHQQAPAMDRGLEPSVLNSLPVFLHSAAEEPPQQLSECAVCLSEFEEKETVRLLPKCNHSFHIECIDMWFHSHSTCPLCRSPVEAVVKQVEPDVGIPEPVEPGLCASCQECGTMSSGGARKGLEVRIEVPSRRFQFENESGQGSPAGRFLSRIISMGRKSPIGSGGGGYTPCGAGTSGGSGGEFDLESGISESTRTNTPK